jgi:hypothetical protein
LAWSLNPWLKAVGDVEAGAVAAFAEAPEGTDGDFGVQRGYRDHLRARQSEKLFETTAPRLALFSFRHKGKLHPCDRGNKAKWRAVDSLAVQTFIGFIEQNGNDRRRIDDHQVQRPSSS